MDKKKLDALFLAIKVGNVMCDNVKERNAWTVRMLRAALGEAVNFPDDWDDLLEKEKERRLDLICQLLMK